MREARVFETDGYKVYAKKLQFLEPLEFETNDRRYYKKCLEAPLSPYLDEDGSVEICGNFKGCGFTMGNHQTNSSARTNVRSPATEPKRLAISERLLGINQRTAVRGIPRSDIRD